MKVSIDQIKNLREVTSAPIMECKKALKVGGGDLKKAEAWLKKKDLVRAKKKKGEATKEGLIHGYIHAGGKVGAMVKVTCQTDFVARNEAFVKLVHEIAMQVAAMNPKNVEALLKQEYIRDPERKIGDLINEAIAKFGENIQIEAIARFKI
jgi:elongation factor Ts